MRLLTLSLILAMAAGFAQTGRPAFEVASIKLNTHCDPRGMSGGRSTPGRIDMECADLRDLILTAYGIYGDGANPASGSFRMQVVGGPAWMDSTGYDIMAKPEGNPPRSEMFGPMLRSLLEERFGLKVHRESREGAVYHLTVAKDGPKLRATKEGSCVVADIDHPVPAGVQPCGKAKTSSGGAVVMVDIVGATMENLCSQLGLVMDREVVDRTGIAGRFDIHLEVTRGKMQTKFVAGRTLETEHGNDSVDAGPSISSAIARQLGLRIVGARGPVPVIVVDRMERLKEN